MRRPVKIDLTEISSSAGLVFAANYVLIVFAIIGLSVEASDLFFGSSATGSGHWWERYVAGPAISGLMIVYLLLAFTIDYSEQYWRWHARAGGIFAAVLLGGIGVALVTMFEFSWVYLIVSAIFLTIFSPIAMAALGLLGSSTAMLDATITPYKASLTSVLARVAAFREPISAQRRRAPPRLAFVGRLLVGISLMGIGLIGLAFVLMAFYEDHDRKLYDTIAGLGGLGLYLLPLWGLLLVLGQRLAQPDARRLLETDKRSPVLLLRSFADDRKQVRPRNVLSRYMFFGLRTGMRLEAAIADELVALGPFIAIGTPGERLAQLGAARSYYPDDEWQDAVLGWMERSRLVVLIAGRSKWFLWELQQVRNRGHLDKTLILFPPGTAEEVQERWQFITDGLGALGPPPETGLNWNGAQPLALHFHPTGAGTLLMSGTATQVDYELAVRLATFGIYCEPDVAPPATNPDTVAPS